MDIRPPFDAVLGAFGLPATVTLPDGTAISTRATWLSMLTADIPAGGGAVRRAEAKKMLALPINDGEDRDGEWTGVPTVPRNTVITVSEEAGLAPSDFSVDAIDRIDFDHHRVIVVPA